MAVENPEWLVDMRNERESLGLRKDVALTQPEGGADLLAPLSSSSSLSSKCTQSASTSSKSSSHLPLWLLQMRENLNMSKTNLSTTTSRIEGLSQSVDKLSTDLERLLVDKPEYIEKKRRRDALQAARSRLTLLPVDLEGGDTKEKDHRKIELDDILCPELWGRVVSFLPIKDMLMMEMLSTGIRALHIAGNPNPNPNPIPNPNPNLKPNPNSNR